MLAAVYRLRSLDARAMYHGHCYSDDLSSGVRGKLTSSCVSGSRFLRLHSVVFLHYYEDAGASATGAEVPHGVGAAGARDRIAKLQMHADTSTCNVQSVPVVGGVNVLVDTAM